MTPEEHPTPHADFPPASRPAPRKKSGPAFDHAGGGRRGTNGYPESVQRLIEEFTKLPGIGRRSAERLVFHVLKAAPDEATALASAIQEVKAKVGHCRVCYNLLDRPLSPAPPPAASPPSAGALCSVCADPKRTASLVMVVEQPKDLVAFEQTGMFKGVYHVLMGRISPLEGVSAGDLTVGDLLGRVRDAAHNAQGVAVDEVILALNPTLESDGTAMYLAQALAGVKRKKTGRTEGAPANKGGGGAGGGGGVRVTRLARGVPTGLQLEYANKAVLADAIEGRRPMM